MKILWLRAATQDLGELFDYLLDRDPGAALAIFETIQAQVARLADYPGMGRPGRVEDTRELVINQTAYIVAYTVDTRRDAVIVLRVLHSARRWPEQFEQQ